MQYLRDIPRPELERRLAGDGVSLTVGPYRFNLKSNLAKVSEGLRKLYADFPLAEADDYIDFPVAIRSTGPLSRPRGKSEFSFEHQRPFGFVPTPQAFAFLEWGMNWCLSAHTNEYLKLHSAVVARDGGAIVMPGVPGAGKSTLCAALGLRGWRILSDEHALLQPGTTDVISACRPVSLKNESIDVIKRFEPDAVFGPESHDTHKGTVAHMKADLAPDSHNTAPLPARMMLFPRYSATDPQRISVRRRTQSFILAAYHSFNYSLMGEAGFDAMRTLIDGVQCYDLVYRDLDWAIQNIGELHTKACRQ